MGDLRAFAGPNAGYVLELYENYQSNPASVDAGWQAFFADFDPSTITLPTRVAAGAPAAVSDGDLWFCPSDGTLHVAYVGKGGSLHEIAWSPGGPQTWTDLTRVALAPPARRDRPSGFCVPGAATRRVVYAAADGRVHEIRWGEGGAEPGGRP